MRFYFHSRFHPGLRTVITHELESLPVLEHVVLSVAPQFIVELGTFFYGLTALLHETDKRLPLFSYDRWDWAKRSHRSRLPITEREVAEFRSKVFGGKVKFIRGDVLSAPNAGLVSLLSKPQRKLFYCDNGDKPKELCLYAPILQPGDVLGVHDWGMEVDLKSPGVGKALGGFTPMDQFNTLLERHDCSSRFFVRK